MYVYRSKVFKLLTITNLGRCENYREFKYSFLYSLMYSKLSINSVSYFIINKYIVLNTHVISLVKPYGHHSDFVVSQDPKI